MTDRIASMLSSVPELWKGIGVIVAILTTGFALGLTFNALTVIPNRVDSIETELTDMRQAVEQDIYTLKTSVNDLRGVLREVVNELELQNCLTLSERTGGDWRACRQKPSIMQ
jgi:hypothetical protein